jgi:hypothetical protein
VLDNSSVYPMGMTTLSSGTPVTVRLSGGGSAFVRFAVGAGKSATVGWDALPAGVTMALVRTK